MKDRPVSHKNQNTFRFQTFSERLSQINIDVIHKLGKISTNPEDADTFFLEAIEKCRELNYSEDYMALEKEIGPEIRTLSQIVFRQEEITSILLKYLSKEGSLALNAILELIVALARDLQYEFYPDFPRFFTAVSIHLTTQDTDLLEKLFTCLAYLFKFLWRYMVKDIKDVFRLFSSLLSVNNREHVRNFAVESFAFLIRKVSNKKDFFEFIFRGLTNEPEQASGVGQLFFEVIKGVKEQFHSCADAVLKLLLKFLGNMLFEDLKENELSFGAVEQALHQMLSSMAKHTSQKYSIFVQNVFCDIIAELQDKMLSDVNTSYVADQLSRTLRLFLFWLNYKDGELLTSTTTITQVLTSLCSWNNYPDDCMMVVTDIVSTVLISCCIKVSVESVNSMISKIYQSASSNVIFHFTRKMFKYGMFEKDVLPNLLTYCVDQLKYENPSAQVDTLQILSETITSLRPIIKCGEDIKLFKKMYLYSPVKRDASKDKDNQTALTCNILESFIIQTVESHKDILLENNIVEVWSALVCLPHLRFFNINYVADVIEKLCLSVQGQLLSSQSFTSKEAEQLSFVLCQAYFSWLCITADRKKESCFNQFFFIDLIRKHPKSVSLLRMSDLYFNSEKHCSLEEIDESFFGQIIPNLASPYHLVRLFTLRILSSFNFNMPLSDNENEVSNENVFNICLEAEKLSLQVLNYREKLKWLSRLEYPSIVKFIPLNNEELVKVPIYYLFGMLYVNFRLLWDPSIKLIESFAHGYGKVFWELFCPYLNDVTELLEKSCIENESEMDDTEAMGDGEALFLSNMEVFCGTEETPDVLNHRLLLCKAMAEFSDVVEPKNKSFVPFLFRFIRNEIGKVDMILAPSEAVNKTSSICDGSLVDISYETPMQADDDILESTETKGRKRKRHIRRTKTFKRQALSDEDDDINDKSLSESLNESGMQKTENEDDGEALLDAGNESLKQIPEDINSESEDENADSEEEVHEVPVSKKDKKRKVVSGTKRRNVIKTLGAYLLVFTKFKNPKAMHRSEELEALYNELLCYKDPEIQKLAFDCILTYGHKYLSPYKESFYKILDNKTFKTEVVLFSLDSQNAVILEDHRMNVLAVLMRILHGKMLFKTGNNTTGRAHAQTRQSLVLRFLAGCRAEELKMFFDLVFASFKEHLNGNIHEIVINIRQNLDMTSIIPLRKQHSALNTMQLILQHLGSLVPELLPWLLKVLVVITSTSTVLLEKREDVLPHCVTLLKSIRILAVMRLIQFFKHFTKYSFTPEEIDSIFEAIIWPMIPRLEFESLNQPSPLLRLLATWSENPRYFILFAKQKDESGSLSCLPHLMSLYAAPRTKAKVVGLVSKIILQLLTLQENITEEEDWLPPIGVNFSSSGVATDTQNFGTVLLLPHVDKILQRLNVLILTASKMKNASSLNTRDLTILLKISSFINDAEQSANLIKLLIPFLSKKKLPADSEVLILSTISNLIRKTENPEDFINLFSPLFGKLTNQNSRTALAEVFQTIAEIKIDMQEVASIVKKVNAWDGSFIGEPDYQQRLDGHREALQLIKSMNDSSINGEFCRIIIFNSCFMIRTVDDLAVRNSASYLLKEIVQAFPTFKESLPLLYAQLIFDCLLLEVRKGLNCELEAIRHEFISILAVVLRNNKEHPKLSEIASLCHDDPDMDFWENICHLQFHRRARALQRFSTHLNERKNNGEDISPHYILTYLMPVMSSFLFDSAYLKQIHVVDAAIEAIGAIANILPWVHYEPLLKNYLNMLSKNAEYHKTIVKVIVSVINAFHFDLKLDPTDNIKSVLLNTEPDAVCKEIEVAVANEEAVVSDVATENAISELDKKNELTADMEIKIYNTITKSILPLLHRSLMKKTKRDNEHKLAGHVYPEDEEILRVPIALAMIKLLQKLPVKILERNLHGLFLKMCELLKSKAESIRETARETLMKMMHSLGPKYFQYLLPEMIGVMTKGYQIHVMMFTINAVLTKLSDQLQSGDLDPCVSSLTKACINELFSDVAEEKEVAKITGKLKEARSIKSYSIYQMLSRFVSECHLLDLIVPLKELMAIKHKHKAVRKIQECLRNVALGLSENTGLSMKGLLIFVYAICNENIPQLNQKRPVESVKNKKFVRPDIYLVPSEPGRSGPPAKINVRTNAHVLVEFGLQLFSFSLKKNKECKTSQEIQQMLDPFVSLTTECLSSNHIKIISTSLRCLMWLCKLPLPSLKQCSSKIVNGLFLILNKYAAVGMGQGDNFEMVVMCFKVLTIIVKDTNYHTLSTDQLHVLLSYVEQDLFDYTRQSTAFTLLKAILSKKLESPELRGIMSKVAEMSITAEQEYIRSQSRQVCMQYMMDYPLGKQLQKSISFFLSQLEYFHEHGRISALEMIHTMLSSFPPDVIEKHSGLFLVPLSARLVNDESIKCRKMSSQCIKILLKQLGHEERNSLFNIGLTWLQSETLSHQRLGAQLCGIFAEVETENFEHRLRDILSIVIEKVAAAKDTEAKTDTVERSTDHFLYQLLNSFAKMLSFCSIVNKQEYSGELNQLWGHLQALILHPHSWVRLSVSQLFGILFAAYKVEEILAAITSKNKKKGPNVFLCSRQKLRDLSADFATQLQSPYLNESLGEQVIRNLVYLAKVISKLPEKQDALTEQTQSDSVSSEDSQIEVTLSWMIRKLCREVKKEVAQTPSHSQKRKCVFMFIGAIAHELEREKLMPVLDNLLLPLCRELSDSSKNADESLKKSAQEVLDLLKKTAGVEAFSSSYAKVQSDLFKKKVKRKHDRAIEAVTDPERYAKKRIKKQLSKKETKKRKIQMHKGKRKTKKAKLTNLVIAS